jgi:hypothetical protein
VNLADVLGGHNQASLEMHWEAEIERVWRCTGRRRSSNSKMHIEAELKFNSDTLLEPVIGQV